MTAKNFKNSQSPRASRASTQDPLEHAKGEVQYELVRVESRSGDERDISLPPSDLSILAGMHDAEVDTQVGTSRPGDAS